jgi:acyl carrier protein
MSIDSIIEALDAFVREQFEIEDDDPDYNVELNLFDYGYVDSLGAAEIILFVEESYSCEITQRDISLYPMNSVREIAKVVASKLG